MSQAQMTTAPPFTSPAPPIECANCDRPFANETEYYECRDCPSDLTHTCLTCCLALHRPHQRARHRLKRSRQAEEDVRGHGFCWYCLTLPSKSSQPALAELECEECSNIKSKEANQTIKVGYCLECDGVVHSSLDMDAHTRQYFDEPALVLQTDTFTLGGVAQLELHHRDGMESYAGRIWPGSLMLARYCEQLADKDSKVFDQARVLELGCGCAAIPSVTAYLLGATRVLCTDMNEDGLEILKQNILSLKQQLQDRHHPLAATHPIDETNFTTHRLAFGETVPSSLIDSFDIILGSYILYDPDSFIPLANTIHELVSSTAKTLILLTSHEPTREGVFLTAIEERGFDWHRIPFSLQSAHLSDEQHDEGAKSNLGTGLRSTSILRLQRRSVSLQPQPSTDSTTSSPIAQTAKSE